MADAEDIQPLVCDNGTGMVKVTILSVWFHIISILSFYSDEKFSKFSAGTSADFFGVVIISRLVLLVMMLQGQFSLVLLADLVTQASWLGWVKRMLT